MSERAAAALAAATALGAALGGGPPLPVAAALALVAVAARRPWLLCLAAALAAAALADRAAAGLDPPAVGPWRGLATLAADPEPLDGGGVRVDVVAGGRRLEATAHGPAAWALEPMLAGERVVLDGDVRPAPPTPWLRQRRVVGRLAVREVGERAPAAPAAAAANRLRHTLANGAEGMPARSASLLAGVVLGDDRHQPPEVVDDFRAAGLAHLLAVSGQNLAAVLAIAGPPLRWLPGRARAAGTLAVLGFFGLAVRFEPSVLRAGAMTGIGAVAAALGRPAEGLRALALAVALLLLVDPLLVGSVGFGLSVGASAGILLLGGRLAAALPGPRPLAEALAVTLAAQAGVAPLLLATFGPVPVATVPANLLAAPAAAPLVVWGLTGGLAAGLVDGWPRTVLQVPTRVLTWWLAEVGERCAAWPLGELGTAGAVAVACGVALAVAARRAGVGGAGRRTLGVAAAVAVLVPCAAAAAGRPALADGVHEVADGATAHRAGGATVVLLDGGARPEPVLEGLRRAGDRCPEVVAVAGGGLAARRAAASLGRRCPGAALVAPAGEALPGWQALADGAAVRAGGLVVTATGGTLAVSAAPPPIGPGGVALGQGRHR